MAYIPEKIAIFAITRPNVCRAPGLPRYRIMKMTSKAGVKVMSISIISAVKLGLSNLKNAYMAVNYIGNYYKLKKAAPYTFTVIANAKKSSVATFTTGKVMSLTLWKVVIEGNQVEDLLVDGQVHEIPLYRIRGITEHEDARSI